MSGGSFDYAFFRVEMFANELEDKLAKNELGEVPPEVTARLARLVVEARRLAALMKEAEWLYSGDTGDASFLARVAKIEAADNERSPP